MMQIHDVNDRDCLLGKQITSFTRADGGWEFWGDGRGEFRRRGQDWRKKEMGCKQEFLRCVQERQVRGSRTVEKGLGGLQTGLKGQIWVGVHEDEDSLES